MPDTKTSSSASKDLGQAGHNPEPPSGDHPKTSDVPKGDKPAEHKPGEQTVSVVAPLPQPKLETRTLKSTFTPNIEFGPVYPPDQMNREAEDKKKEEHKEHKEEKNVKAQEHKK